MLLFASARVILSAKKRNRADMIAANTGNPALAFRSLRRAALANEKKGGLNNLATCGRALPGRCGQTSDELRAQYDRYSRTGSTGTGCRLRDETEPPALSQSSPAISGSDRQMLASS